MNYKHAYHAGNFADVVKHTLLMQLLMQFGSKDKPYYVLDAYGGRGLYSLDSTESKKTQEATRGIQALTASDTDAPQAVQAYLSAQAHARRLYDRHAYAGSPWLIAYHRKHSPHLRAEAFESQASEYDALNYQLYQMPIGIHHRDAFEGVLGVLPPTERRGIVLLDPPFEQEHKDFGRLVDLLVAGYKKFATGCFVLWYPIKNNEAVELFYKKMKRTDLKKQLICTLNIYPNDIKVGLNGTGLLVINPPYEFDKHAKQILDYLAPRLKPSDSPLNTNAMCEVKWLVGE